MKYFLLVGLLFCVTFANTCYSIFGAPSSTKKKEDHDVPGYLKFTSKTTSNELDNYFLICSLCNGPFFYGVPPTVINQVCQSSIIPSRDVVADLFATALMNTSQTQGYFWMDDPGDTEQNATQCLSHLLRYMPRRDLFLLYSQPYQFVDFLFEHVRLSLQTYDWSSKLGVTWDLFLEYVLPYSVLNEKHDLWWRWRPRMLRMFSDVVQSAGSITEAVHTLVTMIPRAQMEGTVSFSYKDETMMIPGPPVTWRSETSPGYLSPQQVVQHGGSCTGTGIFLVLVCRSVGIPTRLAGCSESVIRNDDHHWIEFWDGTSPGPFGDYWHTREGVSQGAEDGPWDAPSQPMSGCLRGVVPGSNIDTIWASSWSSGQFMPTLWSNSTWFSIWGFVGGINRCGVYCTTWGCGNNNTVHWNQAECGPKPNNWF